MKAIIGLGNPGLDYAETRHNVGFLLLDQWGKTRGLSYKGRFRGKFAEDRFDNEKVFLLKPQTYMNLSGMAAAELVGFYQLDPEDLLVVHDDIDLPLGKLRLRAQGGAGGHNGLKSIQTHLGSTEYWRLKIGVGRPTDDDVAGHVLSPFGKAEKQEIEEAVLVGLQVLDLWLRGEAERAMNLFNG
ncbi:MAG: aminoacyl-tRNA hydrolase [Gracilibacteraceae bacterium]|nr:aminoacyl-tRNA hydrolase [Gracilibacteraceae bacterium]